MRCDVSARPDRHDDRRVRVDSSPQSELCLLLRQPSSSSRFLLVQLDLSRLQIILIIRTSRLQKLPDLWCLWTDSEGQELLAMEPVEQRVDSVIRQNELGHLTSVVRELSGESSEGSASLAIRTELSGQVDRVVVGGGVRLHVLNGQVQIVQLGHVEMSSDLAEEGGWIVSGSAGSSALGAVWRWLDSDWTIGDSRRRWVPGGCSDIRVGGH